MPVRSKPRIVFAGGRWHASGGDWRRHLAARTIAHRLNRGKANAR